MTIIDLISALFERSRLNKADFCSKMEISRQTLDNWLNKKKYPNTEDLTRIAKILDVMVLVSLDREGVSEDDYIAMAKRLSKCLVENEDLKKNVPYTTNQP